MGASLGNIDDDDEFGEAHEINVTPFIDVMLVLLIIFMIAAPLSTVDLPVDLPSSTATPQKKPDKPTYVTIKADLAVAIGETPVKRVDLVHALDAVPEQGKDRRIFLRAVGLRHALVLTQMVEPGVRQEGLDKASLLVRVLEHTPIPGAVASAFPAHKLDRGLAKRARRYGDSISFCMPRWRWARTAQSSPPAFIARTSWSMAISAPPTFRRNVSVT